MIGKGGMGEVYQAKDQKLGREVAIKVLPEEFAKDADRVARFQREAKVLASLNHPNIAAVRVGASTAQSYTSSLKKVSCAFPRTEGLRRCS
jgi:serine/threonine protein kinase